MDTVAVSVLPLTGGFAAMAIAGVSWYLPPKGMITLAAPIVESNISPSPLVLHTLSLPISERMAPLTSPPSRYTFAVGEGVFRYSVTLSFTTAFWRCFTPFVFRNSRFNSTMQRPA